MGTPIDRYTLKRLDWHDEEGRIYKDVLIENFNDMEDKLIELARLDVTDIALPDVSGISYEDVDWDSDDNKIVNLRSFLNMTGLMNYPIECEFNGTKCTRIAWWGSDYKYHVVTDDGTQASQTNPYIYFNPNDDNHVFANNNVVTPTGCHFIGFYDSNNGVVINTTSIPLNLNVLEGLSQMKTNSVTRWTGIYDGKQNGGGIPWNEASQNTVASFYYQEKNKSFQEAKFTSFGQE